MSAKMYFFEQLNVCAAVNEVSRKDILMGVITELNERNIPLRIMSDLRSIVDDADTEITLNYLQGNRNAAMFTQVEEINYVTTILDMFADNAR